jgi:LysM repeat protein
MTEAERVKRGERLRVPMTVMAPQTGAPATPAAHTAPANDGSVNQGSPVPNNTTDGKAHLIKYRVHRGETISTIANRLGVSVSELRSWNNLGHRAGVRKGQTIKVYQQSKSAYAAAVDDRSSTTKSKSKKGNAEVASSEKGSSEKSAAHYHTVAHGETMTRIAKTYGVTSDQISEWNNGLTSPELQAGMKLKIFGGAVAEAKADRVSIPAKAWHRALVYKVKRGDTLYSIAGKYDVAVADIKRANHIHGGTIAAGAHLRIPN